MDSNLANRSASFIDRLARWGEEYKKRNRGFVEFSSDFTVELSAKLHAQIWDSRENGHNVRKNVAAMSPKSNHPSLDKMFPQNYRAMEGFHHKLDVEADPNYEGMIPGTVSLHGYTEEGNRHRRRIFEQQKSVVVSVDPQADCDTCLELCLEGDIIPKTMKASLKSIETSIKGGCQSCKLLRDGIDLCQPYFKTGGSGFESGKTNPDAYFMAQRQGYTAGDRRYKFGENEKVINWAVGRGCGLCITYIYRSGQEDTVGTVAELDFFTQKSETTTKCPWKSVRESTKISGDTSSEQSFSCAIDWIEDCKRSHRTCTVSTTGVLPDRVLDLGFADFLSESPVKLYETKNENDDYVCLSYCWGKAQNLTTKKGNLQAHIKGLTWDVLPQTFRDAIIFTRRLKIRYLWIDSLCIIQDDNKDWQRQACKMPAIYENSYVTIAATASDSSTGGCFRKAEQRYKAQELSIEDRSGTTHKIFVRHHLPHWMSANPRYFGRHFEEFPIWNRGWIMQERLLAPRVIHFGRHELMWECTEAARCECSFLDHIGRDHEIDEDNSKLDKIRHYRSIAQDKEEKEETQLTRQSIYEASPPQRWRALVSKYSSLSLTMEKDIFPALAGLAKQWNRNVNDEYIAGMWKGNLPIDLLWQVMSPQKRKIEHSNWRAPSWSWAHDKYHVEWVNDLKNVCDPEIHLTVLDAGQTPTGEDMMGEISFAYLVGLATLCPGKLIIFPPAEHPQASLIIDREWINELPDPSATIYGMRTEIHLDRMMEPTCECKGREDRTVPMSGWDVYCMKVATLAFKEYSLILRYDPVSKTYTRCGILEEDVGPPVERRKGRVPWDSTSCVREIIALW